MNYLAHAYRHLHDPYFVAGTALPDWMNVIDRKNRPRSQYAEPVTRHVDARWATVAQGCLQHHADDQWFHQTADFVKLSTQFAVELRSQLAAGMGHQAGFVGHIAVELLLDAALIEREPQLLDNYYAVLNELDPQVVQAAASEICPRPVTRLSELLPRFVEARFLADYLDDRRLLYRLNGVMRRISLPELPDTLIAWLASARLRVHDSLELLLRPNGV